MDASRRTATIVGVLFILATVGFIVGQAIYDPVLASADSLDAAYPERATVIAGVLVGLIGVLAIPLIPVFLFPIFKRYDEALALGYFGFRLIEAMLLMVTAAGLLSLVNVSEQYLNSDGDAAARWRDIGGSIQFVGDWAFALSVGVVFSLGALILYTVLYQLRLVPALISVWGLIAAAILLVGSVLVSFEAFSGIDQGLVELVVAGPIAINEFVLAGWLIVKGFATPAVEPAQVDTPTRIGTHA